MLLMRTFLTIAVIFCSAVTVQPPSEETKAKALRCAYMINGTFGLGPDERPYPMIDATKLDLDHCVRK
jgi:hypothetical protein